MPKPANKRTAVCCRGLSRLEFTLALIVIALLTSVLLARLAELGTTARRQRLHATMVSVQTAATMFHLLCEARRATGSDCAALDVAGAPVQGVNGWPAASRTGIAGLVSALRAGPALPGTRLYLQPATRAGRPALLIALGDRHCEFSYAQAASPGDSPEVDLVDDSCH